MNPQPQSSKGRWTYRYLSVAVGLLMCATSGTLYAFSTYATSLQDQLGYSSVEISVIVGVGDNGLYLAGVPFGFLVDRYGPKVRSRVD